MKEIEMAELCYKYRKNIANLCIVESKVLDDSEHPTAVSMTLDNGDKVVYIPHEEPEQEEINIGDVVKVVEKPNGWYRLFAGQKGVVVYYCYVPSLGLKCYNVLLKDGKLLSFPADNIVKDKGSFDLQWMLDRI